jgi:cell division protein FtsN
VLVAIAVWLIPWVLDGPENPVESGPASLQLPASQEPVPMRTQTLKLGEPPAAAQPTDTATEKTETPAPPAAETVVAAATPEPTKPGATAPGAAPAGAAPPPTATSPAPKPEAADTKRKAAVGTPAPATAATAVKGDWTVQLGVFADESNARRLADRASTFGYKASVANYKANGKTMYRVRVGAYGSKGQADATASALGAHGITAKVVAAD